MAVSYYWPSVALVVGLVLFYGAKLLQVGMRPKDLPPGKKIAENPALLRLVLLTLSCVAGPPTVPILGNLHQMTANPYLMFEKWATKCKDNFLLSSVMILTP